jgi:hypothetical protein
MIIKRAMTMRFTWDDAADQYEKVFFAAVRGRLSEDEFRQRFGEILTRGIQTRSAGNFITVRGAEEHRVSVFEEV